MVGRRIAAALFALCLAGTALAAGEAPLSPEAQTLFDDAFTALEAGKPAQALPLYERALEKAPGSWRIWSEYTICLRQLNRQPAAARAGWRTVQLSPAKENAGWVNLGNVFSQAHRFEEASAAYDKALEADGDKGKASNRFTSLGYEAENAGARDRALAFYERALALNPRHVIALADKGRVLHCLGGPRGKESGDCFEKAQKIAQKEKDTQALSYVLGTMLGLQKTETCAPWMATLSCQPLPEALLTRPPGDATQLPLPATVERRWRLPSGKSASITTPENWEETLEDTDTDRGVLLFTASFENPQSLRWNLKASPLSEKVREFIKEPRRYAETMMNASKGDAAEAELALQELKGAKAAGWYYTATDKGMVGKPAVPDQWLYQTQGVLETGGQWFSFTLLTHSKEPAELNLVLEALATLRVE